LCISSFSTFCVVGELILNIYDVFWLWQLSLCANTDISQKIIYWVTLQMSGQYILAIQTKYKIMYLFYSCEQLMSVDFKQ